MAANRRKPQVPMPKALIGAKLAQDQHQTLQGGENLKHKTKAATNSRSKHSRSHRCSTKRPHSTATPTSVPPGSKVSQESEDELKEISLRDWYCPTPIEFPIGFETVLFSKKSASTPIANSTTQVQWETTIREILSTPDDLSGNRFKFYEPFIYKKEIQLSPGRKQSTTIGSEDRGEAEKQYDSRPKPLLRRVEWVKKFTKSTYSLAKPFRTDVLPGLEHDQFEFLSPAPDRPQSEKGLHVTRSPEMDLGKSKDGVKMTFNHDLSFLARAREEIVNDTELVKGEGVRHINQQHAEWRVGDYDRQFDLPSSSRAAKDLQLALFNCVLDDQTYQTSKTDELKLDYLGNVVWAFEVSSNSVPFLSVNFSEIREMKFHSDLQRLFFAYKSPAENQTFKSVSLDLSQANQTAWRELKACCYKLADAGGGKRTFDAVEPKWFDSIEQKIITRRTPRSVPSIVKHTPLRKKKKTTGIFRPISKMPAAISSSNTTTAPSPKPLKAKASDMTIQSPSSPAETVEKMKGEMVVNLSLVSPGHILDDETVSEVENKDKKKTKKEQQSTRAHEVSISSEATQLRLFYKMISRKDKRIPVMIGDSVVCLRDDQEVMGNGKRDRYDIFDGPWKIDAMSRAEDINTLDESDKESDANNSESSNWSEMLKTKVRLKYPKDSVVVDRWKEIGNLLPLIEPRDVLSAKVTVASCSTVASLVKFKEILRAMKSPEEAIDRARIVAAQKNKTDQEGTTSTVDMDCDEAVGFVKIRKGTFVGVIEVAPHGLDNNEWEVEKLRGKRLRLLDAQDPRVVNQGIKTDSEDPWVKKLMKQWPEEIQGKIIFAEYKVVWYGWSSEDATWEIGQGNISQAFIDEYHELTDPWRGDDENGLVLPKDVIFADDLDMLNKKEPGSEEADAKKTKGKTKKKGKGKAKINSG